MIVDNRGEPVWFKPLQSEEEEVWDFKVQRYRGEEVPSGRASKEAKVPPSTASSIAPTKRQGEYVQVTVIKGTSTNSSSPLEAVRSLRSIPG
jgi:hypothetical protein